MPFLLLAAIGGTAVFAGLTYLVGTDAHLLGIDNGVATWASVHVTPFWRDVLKAVTQLGSIYTVVALAIVVVVVDRIARRSLRVVPLLVAVVGGEEILVNTIKALVDRARPAFNPAAASLGPAFPSGHAANAAAFYAVAAFVLACRRGRTAHVVLASLAAAIAVAVAASRVLLDLHWLTDVVGGLALGWAWFAVCAMTFGNRYRRRPTAAG